jgi:NitT/TauT family transport system permease protein
MKRLVSLVAPPLVALALLLALWEGLVRALEVQAFLLPPPSAIARACFVHGAVLASGVVRTGSTAVAGFLLSAALGNAIAYVLGSSRMLERAFYPYTLFLQTVPIVTIAPLLVLWFGSGSTAVAVAAFIVSVFPVITGTLSGMRAVDPNLRDLFRLHGASRFAVLTKLEIPAALPQTVTGLRVASGLAVIGTIVGEFVAGFADEAPGLGIIVLSAYRQLKTDLLFAAVLGSSVLGLGLFAAVQALGHRLLRRWHPSARS